MTALPAALPPRESTSKTAALMRFAAALHRANARLPPPPFSVPASCLRHDDRSRQSDDGDVAPNERPKGPAQAALGVVAKCHRSDDPFPRRCARRERRRGNRHRRPSRGICQRRRDTGPLVRSASRGLPFSVARSPMAENTRVFTSPRSSSTCARAASDIPLRENGSPALFHS